MEATTSPSEDLLELEPEPVRASSGQRFANYLIDLVIFYLLFFIAGIILALVSPSSLENLDDTSSGFGLLDRLITIVLYGVYMGIVESVFKGKSLGKLITGTRAVNLDGSRITAGTAFARGFSRAVPFCAFSALSTPCDPWQDRWTNTMVMDEKQSKVQ